MKPSEQRLTEVRRQHIEAIVARHVRDLFTRLPLLAGFWLRLDLDAEVTVLSRPGNNSMPGLYEEVMRSLIALAEEHPEAVGLMRGRTFARSLH